MDEPAGDLGGDGDALIEGYFRDQGLLAASTADALRTPDRRVPPRSPDYDGRLFDWLVVQLLPGTAGGAERAWPVILEVIRRAPSPEVLTFIGSGALEDLVNGAGTAFAPRILERAASDARFARALACVWPDPGVPDAVVSAIVAARRMT